VLFVILVFGCTSLDGQAAPIPVNYPGAFNTYVYGISDGRVAGMYNDNSKGSLSRGFVYDGTAFTTIDVPGALATTVFGIDGTRLVGQYADGTTGQGFLYDGTNFITITVPNAISTSVSGISGGTVSGYFTDLNGNTHGFLYQAGNFTVIDVPGGSDTVIYGIDGTHFVGSYIGPSGRVGFVFDGSSYTTLFGPNGPGDSTMAYGINGGTIVGTFNGGHQSYSFSNGVYSIVPNISGGFNMHAYSIDGNTIAGTYEGPGGFQHGFVYDLNSTTSAVPEPTSLLTFAYGSCVVLLGFRTRKRNQ